jgi:AcrR family transcriptional regulator
MATAKTTGRKRDTAQTRARLLEATRELLMTEGFAATTTRAIAAKAECNQGLISYHFGGLNPLLLEVLDASSDPRLAAYRAALAGVRGMKAVKSAGRSLYADDHASGHTKIMAEMVTAGLVDRELGREVAARVTPWLEVAEQAVRKAVPTAAVQRRLPIREAAHGIVALFIGLEMLGSLAEDRSVGQRVVDRLASKWLLRS